MRNVKEITIGENSFRLIQLPATRALKTFGLLAKVLGPSFLSLAGKDATAIGAALQSLEPSALLDVAKELLLDATCGSQNLNIDRDLDIAGLFELLKESVALNYESFYKGLASAGLAGLAKAGSPTISTGPSLA